MTDIDENGVDRMERFQGYSQRFIQFSVADEVYRETLEYMKHLRQQRDEAIKQRDEARDYSIALQRAIEHHRRGLAVPPAIAANCPHHAQMLNEHLASKEGGGA